MGEVEERSEGVAKGKIAADQKVIHNVVDAMKKVNLSKSQAELLVPIPSLNERVYIRATKGKNTTVLYVEYTAATITSCG